MYCSIVKLSPVISKSASEQVLVLLHLQACSKGNVIYDVWNIIFAMKDVTVELQLLIKVKIAGFGVNKS